MKFSRSPFLALAAATLLAAPISAATSSDAVPNLSSAAKSASEAAAAATASKTDSANTASTTDSATGTDSAAASSGTVSIQPSSVIITGSGSSVSATGTIPTITGGSSADTGGAPPPLPTGLPTLTGGYRIVAPSVPPTSNAPYMQVSNLPEGTVFIVVGAILGFLAMSVLLWRGLVAWSLHRAVKRAAAAQYNSDTKTLFRTPPAPFYKYSDRDSTISLGAIGAKNAKKGGRPPAAQGAASASSLFFSPTAGAAGAGGLANAGNRGSNYLPAGYYAAGASQPGNGQGMTHIGQGHGGAISLSNLGPARDGYARARSMGTTPPDSPAFRPQSSPHGHSYGASSSTLNLNVGGEPRAPSAYLDDLFDGENAPPIPGHGSSPHRF
jgi:hypothetical protein